MRYDDMLATLLAQPAEDATARAALWAQLVDVLAQGRGGGDQQAQGYARLRDLRRHVPAEAARRTLAALAGRELPAPLVAQVVEEPASLAGILLATARMPREDWLALLPSLGPTGRSFLRNRRDLDREVRRALDAFGPADLVLPGSSEPEPQASAPPAPTAEAIAPAAAGPVRIGDLVARIEAYRASGRVTVERPATTTGEFRFETDRHGVIHWVDGIARGAAMGETIAHAGGEQGVDAHAAGAFLRRAPFRDARLTIAAESGGAGEWRISAVPFFDPVDGRFQGYRGAARRPRADEVAPRGRALLGADTPPDTLRQLVHELRTPLNAIVGFAEMIDGQMLGPAAEAYRRRAAGIADDGRRLLSAIEDLDAAARLEGGRWPREAALVDVGGLLARVLPDYVTVASSREATLTASIAPGLPRSPGDALAIERMIARLLGAVTALAEAGEAIVADLSRAGAARLALTVSRPRALAGREERALLDPGFSPNGEWPEGPLLGLGFTLRLVRGIAESSDGALLIEANRFLLHLPAEADSARDEGNG